MSATDVTRIQHAIFAAIEAMHSDTGSASLNDVLSALAAAEARYLSAISDRKLRRAVGSQLDDVRSQMLAGYLRAGGGPKVHTIVMPKVTN